MTFNYSPYCKIGGRIYFDKNKDCFFLKNHVSFVDIPEKKNFSILKVHQRITCNHIKEDDYKNECVFIRDIDNVEYFIYFPILMDFEKDRVYRVVKKKFNDDSFVVLFFQQTDAVYTYDRGIFFAPKENFVCNVNKWRLHVMDRICWNYEELEYSHCITFKCDECANV